MRKRQNCMHKNFPQQYFFRKHSREKNKLKYKHKNSTVKHTIAIVVKLKRNKTQQKNVCQWWIKKEIELKSVCCFTYCFFKHIMEQKLFALPLCVIWRIPSNQIWAKKKDNTKRERENSKCEKLFLVYGEKYPRQKIALPNAHFYIPTQR